MIGDEDFRFEQRGELPKTRALTILWGTDLEDGTRVDYYETFEGDFYKRTIPLGGSLVPQLQGTKEGYEPFWERIDSVPTKPDSR